MKVPRDLNGAQLVKVTGTLCFRIFLVIFTFYGGLVETWGEAG